MVIVIGSDHAGVELKKVISDCVRGMGHDILDIGRFSVDREFTGESSDYPDYAVKAAEMVKLGKADRGILICGTGTGIGMSITANKVPGIRCSLVHDVTSAKLTREHNNPNVLAMGANVVDPELAKEIVQIWMGQSFNPIDRYQRRLDKIKYIESFYST